MAKEYLIQGDTLINIADKIRVLSGTEGALKLDDMAVTLETSNTNLDNELNTQSGLIDQIQTALEGKAAATGEDVGSETTAYTTKLATLETAITALETELQGKASGGGSVETCAVAFDFGTAYDPINEEYVDSMLDVMYIDMSSGEPILADANHRTKKDGDVITVAKNSLVAFRSREINAGIMATSMEVSNDVPFDWNAVNGASFMITDNCTISVNFD
jgi:hypothetical protein